MNRRNIINLTALVALGLALPSAAHAQTANDLVGTWQMVSNVNIATNGTKSDAFGPHGIGIAIFESNGRFAILTNNPDVPKFTSNNRIQGTPDEYKAVAIGNLAFFGTYSVADKAITAKIEGSTYPNWIGTDIKRTIISLSGDDLKYSVAAAASGGQNEVTWKRTK